MEFGKLANIENVDFSLPSDHKLTALTLSGGQNNGKSKHLYIGCTGWGMKEWVGEVYPKGTKAADYLYHYGKQFNTIELNTTHYRTPSVSDIEKWYQQTPADFRFAPKMLQTISHAKNLGFGTDLTPQYCEAIGGLKEKMGICFMQMPPYFQYNDLKILELYLKNFSNHMPLAIELRHEAWFNTPLYFTTLMDMLMAYKVSTVITDVAGRRDVLHQCLTTKTAVIRFVGNDLHPTDYTRLEAWVQKLKTWYAVGLDEVYFFTHTSDNIKAPKLAKFLHDNFLSHVEGVSTRSPQFLINRPVQTSLF
jgi:uncharacterized protein YecE (DUF72 family)